MPVERVFAQIKFRFTCLHEVAMERQAYITGRNACLLKKVMIETIDRAVQLVQGDTIRKIFCRQLLNLGDYILKAKN